MPAPRYNKLLVLDLDETLVHGTNRSLNRPHDFVAGYFIIYKRPHVDAFLAAVTERFHLAVWTAASPGYAVDIVETLFPDPLGLQLFFTSERCTRCYDSERQSVYYVKDLKKVKRRGWDLSRVIAVDDTPATWRRNYGNAVRVQPFLGDPNDDELPHLLRYLDTLGDAPDVRRIEKRGWRKRQSE